MKSQKQQILEMLQKGWHLSKLQMLNKLGIWNSGARIHELRKDGHIIKTEMVKNKATRKEFAVYYIPLMNNL